MIDGNTALLALLIFGVLFDFALICVVVAHIRYISSLYAKITALEASTDMLLQSQTELNNLVIAFLSKTS